MIHLRILTQKKIGRVLLYCSIFSLAFGNDAQLLKTLTTHSKVSKKSLQRLNALVSQSPQPCTTIIKVNTSFPLYKAYPAIETSLPSVQICELPTPAYKLKNVSKSLGIDLYIKREDLTNSIYGGNKNRTLEFFVADAQRMNTNALVTVGSAGSTHAVATAHAAQQKGFSNMYAKLVPHPNSHDVHELLLLLHQYGAIMHFYPSNEAREKGIVQTFLNHKNNYGVFPYFIPSGGSCPLGIVGYVNAMFELKNQIEQGLLPTPDYIYVACGSKGTSAGLVLGAKAVGLTTTIVPVCIKPDDIKTYAESICSLSRQTNELLCKADPTFPRCTISTADLPIVHYCLAEDYGVFTTEGSAAKKLFEEQESITLDGTYTAKAVSGLIHDAKKGNIKGKKVLYWHTYCAHAVIDDPDYKKLPSAAWVYFEQNVQPLDVEDVVNKAR